MYVYTHTHAHGRWKRRHTLVSLTEYHYKLPCRYALDTPKP
jgi:hypothetical protein